MYRRVFVRAPRMRVVESPAQTQASSKGVLARNRIIGYVSPLPRGV